MYARDKIISINKFSERRKIFCHNIADRQVMNFYREKIFNNISKNFTLNFYFFLNVLKIFYYYVAALINIYIVSIFLAERQI